VKENQEDQSSWQISKKNSRAITQVESLTTDLAFVKFYKNNNSIKFFNKINGSSSFFGPLPAELLLQILGYFTLHELYRLKLIHTSWQQTIQTLPNIELFRSYEVTIKGSKLWRYLPAIINDESILTFIKERLLPFQLSKYREKQFDKISTFCTWILDHLILKNSDLSYRKKIISNNLMQQAQFIWNNIQQFGQAENENWYAFLWKHREIQLKVFKAYLDLEGILTTIIFIIQSQHPKADMVHILCDSPASRWLRDEDLIFLSIHHFSLFYKMIQQSLCLHEYFKNPSNFLGHAKQTDLVISNKLQQRLFVLDNLLSRLTPPDWLQYLELDMSDTQYYRTALLEELINHPAISKQLSEILSFRLASLKKERIPLKILEKETIESVLLSLHFDTGIGQSDDDDYTVLEEDHWLQEAYELIQEAKTQVAANRKQRQEIEEHLENFNETQLQIQEQPERIASVEGDEIEITNQGPLSPRPSSPRFLVPPPLVSTKPLPVIQEHVASTSFNWRLALKIGVLILIALIGMGLIFTGVGTVISIPLLITLSLPPIIKFLMLAGGVVSLLASSVIGIYTYHSTKNGKQREPTKLAEPPSDEGLGPIPVVRRNTAGMIQVFNKAPTLFNAKQEEIGSLDQAPPTTYYASPFTNPDQPQNKNITQGTAQQSHAFKLA
jgi:hypothetical protein